MPILGPNPLANPEQYDKIVIAGISNPGVFRLLDGGDRPYKWMINDPPGMQGAIIVYRGWKISEPMKFRFEFWLKEQIDQYYTEIDPLLSYDARKFNPKPIQIYYPSLHVHGIDRIFVKKKFPLVDLGRQLWSVTVEVGEFRPPPRMNVTTKPDEVQTREPTIEDKLDARTAELLEQWKKPVP